MSGETKLTILIKNMTPELRPGGYVFSTVNSVDMILRNDVICEFKEKEGITVILQQEKADHYNLSYEYVASWITLKVHSSLDAIGLTAIFSSELAKHQISCNIMTGYYHDHIFLHKNDGEKAIKVLNQLSKNYEE